jgi:hypothetical protein
VGVSKIKAGEMLVILGTHYVLAFHIECCSELEPIAADSRPWAILKKIWRFCDLYGEYKAKPPTQRRKFILELEQRCGERTPESRVGFYASQ